MQYMLACRTVLDLRSPNDKFISQVLLLAASWHRHCRQHSDLEVFCVGEPGTCLSSFLDEVSASCRPCAPSPNEDFSRSSNKIQAAGPDLAGRRVLLVDNDTCFLGPVEGLASIPSRAIAASEAGNLRVSQEQWALITGDLGLPVIRRRFHPLNARPDTILSPSPAAPPPERPLYLNSGVILFPPAHDHRNLWFTHQRLIHAYFQGHSRWSDAVDGSDQAGFATSVAAYGDFTWLPMGFNYRRGGFHRGLEPLHRIFVLHLTGDVPDGSALDVSQRLEAYWQTFVWPGIARLAPTGSGEAARRTAIARGALDTLLGLVRDYDLDERLEAIRRSSVFG